MLPRSVTAMWDVGRSWRCVVCIAIMSSLAAIVVTGAPILGPDLKNCMPVHLGVYLEPHWATDTGEVMDCCMDTSRPIVDFKFDPNQPMRVRRPAHKVDEEFLRKFELAHELMRALPNDDPRSHYAQNLIHCGYCTGAYNQMGSNVTLDVHRSWFLLPYHRWYTYFRERILGSLVGDDTLAIPYWAWDVQNETSPAANVVPSMFMKKDSSLYDAYRSPTHVPPSGSYPADLLAQESPHNKEPAELRESNYYQMWRTMIGEVQSKETFLGGKFVLGDVPSASRAGVFELGPHGAVHIWTADESDWYYKTMRPNFSAARDAIFFAHHTQLDRLWQMWLDMGGQNYDDPDWLDAEFLFYDENSNIVRVKVRDGLDLDQMRVSYEPIAADWLDYVPKSIRQVNPKLVKKRAGVVQQFWGDVRELLFGGKSLLAMRQEEQKKTLKGRSILTMQVSRPNLISKMSMLEIAKASVLDEVLVVEGVMTKHFLSTASFKIFMDLPEADQDTPLHYAEALSPFTFVEEGRVQSGEGSVVQRPFVHKVGIGSRFDLLGISDVTSVPITFVSVWDDTRVEVEITDVRMELQAVR